MDISEWLVDTFTVSSCEVTLIHLINLHISSCLTFTQVDTVPWGLIWQLWHFLAM